MLAAVHSQHVGRPEDHLHLERFKPVTGLFSEPQGAGFEVVLARSGLTIAVPPGQTTLECVRAAGVDANSSCEEGVCGECETDVLEGTPDHRDSVLSDAERRAGTVMMICCSRAVGQGLGVLDLAVI